jgi:hypothetical protein
MSQLFEDEMVIDQVFGSPNPQMGSPVWSATQIAFATDLQTLCENLLLDDPILQVLDTSIPSTNYHELPHQSPDVQLPDFHEPTSLHDQQFLNFPATPKPPSGVDLDTSLDFSCAPIISLDNSDIEFLPQFSGHFEPSSSYKSAGAVSDVSDTNHHFKGKVVPEESLVEIAVNPSEDIILQPRKRWSNHHNALHVLTFKGLEWIKVRNEIIQIIPSEEGEN